MESGKLLENLFDKKTLNILKLFLKKKEQQMCLQEISKYSRVPLSSTHRIINKLLALDLIVRIKVKHLKVYGLKQNEKTNYLENILEEKKTIIDEFIESILQIKEIKAIILHGKEEKDKASILIIGEGIDNEIIRQAIVKIKEKYSFSINHMTLTEEQFNQMAAINLYSGKKEVLFERQPDI